MMAPKITIKTTQRPKISLVGGGHTHALVLARLSQKPLHDCEVTLINPGPIAIYSGMLPGFIAGHYDRTELQIDLKDLADKAGGRFIDARATGIDLNQRSVILETGERLEYDLASLDIGATTQLTDLHGFQDFGVPVKPLTAFMDAWQVYKTAASAKSIVIIGGGLAGVEVAMAIAFALRSHPQPVDISIIDRHEILSSSTPSVRTRIKTALQDIGVSFFEYEDIKQITKDSVCLRSGRTFSANFNLATSGAVPHNWIAHTGLDLHEGFIRVDEHLQTQSKGVFAVGDCAHLSTDPRPKAGVYAVRQAPVLLDNLRRSITGEALKRYRPQKDYMKLISLGGKTAIIEKHGFALSGAWVWRLKDRIDRAFIRRLTTSE
ncbi:MAG: FAD-dependent oxidoreductase [Pseudomonadota bacterium]